MRASPVMTLMALFLAACGGAAPAPEATEPPAAPTAAPALAPTAEPTTEPTAGPAATEPPAAPTAGPTATPTLAPTAEPTTVPTAAPATGAACLVGAWQATNLIELAAGMFVGRGLAVPPDLAIGGGDLTVVFNPDGRATYSYDHLTLDATIDAYGTTLPMKILVTGQGSAAYDVVDAASITFSEIEAEDLRVETTVGGTPTPMGSLEEVFVVIEDETATYSCAGNVAQFAFPERATAPLILERHR